MTFSKNFSKSSPKGSAVAHQLQESFSIPELSKAFLYWTWNPQVDDETIKKNPSLEKLFNSRDLKLCQISLAYIHDL